MPGRLERATPPSLDGVGLSLIHHGDERADKVILLHGAGANAHWWDHLVATLLPGRHVIAVDFRGHGDSDFPEELIEGAFSDDLDAVVEHVGATDPVLIGHSMGGHVALEHTSRNPRVRGLVMIDPARGASARRSRATRLALHLRRTYATADEAVARFQFVPRAEADERLRESIARHSVREEPDGRYGFKFDPRWFAVPSRKPVSLASVRCPTLLVRGETSRLLTREGAAAFASEIPQLELREVEGAGHHVHVDRPEVVAEALRGFLAGLE